MTDFEKLVEYLNDNNGFTTATKKIIKYKRVHSHEDKNKYTFYIHSGEPITITTMINGNKETHNTCNPGDYVISGVKGEKYVVAAKKMPNNYNIIDDVLITRQQPRIVAKITKALFKKLKIKEPIEFIASWGEKMNLDANDYLVKESENAFYKIDNSVFKTSYNKIN